MDLTDVEKTTFIINWGVFVYKKMPFKLKKGDAINQCLGDYGFKYKIGRNVEIFVDEHCHQIKSLEDFPRILKRLSRCCGTMGSNRISRSVVLVSKIENFWDIEYRIKVSKSTPYKVKAVMEIRSPWILKEIQRLMGCLVALNYFLFELLNDNSLSSKP